MKLMKKMLAAVCMSLVMILGVPMMMPVFVQTVPVEAATKISLNKKKATIYVGKSIQLKIKGTKSKVKWTSNKKSVAKVNSKGKVTGKKVGKAIITAKVEKKTYKCTVTVKEKEIPVSAIALSETYKTVTVGSKFKLVATIIPESATNKKITWQSINNNIATVTNGGMVTAISEGTTYIYATSDNGVTQSCMITVNRDYLAEFNALSLDEKLLVYTIEKIKQRCTTDFEIKKMYGGIVNCPYQWSGSQAVYISYIPVGYSGIIPNYGSMYNADSNVVTAIGSYSGDITFSAKKEYINHKKLSTIYNGLIDAGYSLKELMNAQS